MIPADRILTTKLMPLERLNPAHLCAFAEANKERLDEFMPGYAKLSTPEAAEDYFYVVYQLWTNGGYQGYAIMDGRIIVGIIEVGDHQEYRRSASISFAIDQAHEGLGIMHKHLKEVIDRVFAKSGKRALAFPVDRLNCYIAANNTRSLKLAERLGFQNEGVMRGGEVVHGERTDMVVLGLLEDEWRGGAG